MSDEEFEGCGKKIKGQIREEIGKIRTTKRTEQVEGTVQEEIEKLRKVEK